MVLAKYIMSLELQHIPTRLLITQ